MAAITALNNAMQQKRQTAIYEWRKEVCGVFDWYTFTVEVLGQRWTGAKLKTKKMAKESAATEAIYALGLVPIGFRRKFHVYSDSEED